MINELNFSQRTFLVAPTKSVPFGFIFLTFATTSSANDIVKSFNEIKASLLAKGQKLGVFESTPKNESNKKVDDVPKPDINPNDLPF